MKLHCGFREGFNAEEIWRKYLDTDDHDITGLIDLTKAFDCIDHQLLIANPKHMG